MTDTALSTAAAVEALWGGVRIVVIDLETTHSPTDRHDRALSFAAVTCRAGTVRGKWQTLINPGVPIARESRAVHGLTDAHLEGEPMFADVADQLLPLFSPADGETLVVAGHNVGYDISVLRGDLTLVGRELPDVPVLDTMGKLVALADVHPDGGSLAALLATLELTNARPHDALADATACAEALVELLRRAADRGHTDFDTLLEEVSGGATTATIRSKGRIRGGTSTAAVPALPPEHTEGHTTVLSRRAGVRMLAAWTDQVAECAALRCGHLADRVAVAEAPGPKVLACLEEVLRERADAGDTAGAATVLAPLITLTEHLPHTRGQLGYRNGALNWATSIGTALDPLGRCTDDDQCPACRQQEPCALDTWPDAIAARALGDPDRYAAGFFETKGREAGTGAYTTWLAKGVDRRIADAAVWLCHQHWVAVGQDVRANQLAVLAWAAGCRHPDLVDHHVHAVASGGRPSDLNAALKVCDTALAARGGSTHDGWNRLETHRNLLDGRAERLRFRHSGTYDADGNPIPARRHTPTRPQRTRPPRFLRA
jgi:DNA polymerase-3 subunit epsilon